MSDPFERNSSPPGETEDVHGSVPGLDPDPLDAAALNHTLADRCRIGQHLEIHPECSSTNDLLKQRIREGEAAGGTLMTCEYQSGGRGRRTSDWWSGPRATNLAFSIALNPAPEPLVLVGICAALSLTEVLREWTHDPCAAKWPNDVLIGGAKTAGILVEIPAGSQHQGTAVLGVGLNVHQGPPSSCAPYPTTCLAHHSSRKPNRTRLLSQFCWELQTQLDRLEAVGTPPLEADYLELLRLWAPHGVRLRDEPHLPGGPLIEFSVSDGLRWGRADQVIQRPLGWVRGLEALPR